MLRHTVKTEEIEMKDGFRNDEFLCDLEALCLRYDVHFSYDLNGISAQSENGSVNVELPKRFEHGNKWK
jgi:hypothetical protein